MVTPDPKMSDGLYAKCVEFAFDPDTTQNIDQLMVEYWDEVSDAVLAHSKKHKVPPMYTIMEFCTDSDFPEEVDDGKDD